MARRRVDVRGHERERHGRREIVRPYSQMREGSAEESPSMLPMRRPPLNQHAEVDAGAETPERWFLYFFTPSKLDPVEQRMFWAASDEANGVPRTPVDRLRILVNTEPDPSQMSPYLRLAADKLGKLQHDPHKPATHGRPPGARLYRHFPPGPYSEKRADEIVSGIRELDGFAYVEVSEGPGGRIEVWTDSEAVRGGD